uniref:Uncharacterized protein n=1 Tax=Glossina austeni TaxID=7395 RepID=A0A1A9V7H7_GLOAU
MKFRTGHDDERPDRSSTSTNGHYVKTVKDPVLKISQSASIQVIWVLSAFKINAPSSIAVALRSCSVTNPAEAFSQPPYSSWRLMRQLVGILNNVYLTRQRMPMGPTRFPVRFTMSPYLSVSTQLTINCCLDIY